ncbi:hypothetical protein ACFSQD_07320 [Flavihumibacter stibioxidans]|uniref:Outer membrane protein beta-barrel domain-containing protein n=1 Tax=Flavihumibacter stibioxidans TaxID=1834163 RepID=A0ABR7M5D6_9BACT|nr:hypothetical protein [Flavihumibacter stibioxidans]MBC6490121.1 hypothetical protein [Flavihumibacter stibioxidans]
MKKLLIAALALFALTKTNAQSFMHGAGTGLSVVTMKNGDPSAYGTLLYSPRLTVMETETSSITVGIPLTLGLAGSYSYDNYYGESSDIQYLVNAPLMVNLNIGAGSSPITEDRFGFFIGGGFGINYGNYLVDDVIIVDGFEYYDQVSKNVTTYGPAANAGVRIGVGRQTKNIEILLSYMKGINETKPNTFGLACLFNF